MPIDLEKVLEISHVVKQFSVPDGRHLTACDDVSLTLYKGETLGIVGESGCGKSTLVKTVMQLYAPTSGAVYHRGVDITKLRGKLRAKIGSTFRWYFKTLCRPLILR